MTDEELMPDTNTRDSDVVAGLLGLTLLGFAGWFTYVGMHKYGMWTLVIVVFYAGFIKLMENANT